MSGCESTCSNVKKRLSKVSLKMLRNLSLPGNKIPDWFSQGPLTFLAQAKRELRGVILAVVVSVNHEIGGDDNQLNDVVGIQAQILELDLKPKYSHTFNLAGVPRTSDDQLHVYSYSALHPMVTMLDNGYTIQVIKREQPSIKQGLEIKRHDIYLIYEGDDDLEGDEHILTET